MGVGNDPLFLYIQIKDMDITLYSSVGCGYCTKTKELFARAGVEYTEIIWQELEGDVQVEIQERYPTATGFPMVIIDGEFVGGLVHVAKKFLKEGLVSAPQK